MRVGRVHQGLDLREVKDGWMMSANHGEESLVLLETGVSTPCTSTAPDVSWMVVACKRMPRELDSPMT